MARGWESKSVESQIESAESRPSPAGARQTEDELARVRERESLQLSRVRVLHDLEGARNPNYRASLEAALRHLDGKIAALMPVRTSAAGR
jgi:hypothetical protein